MSVTDARRRLVDIARSLDSVGARSDRRRYVECIAPGESSARVADMVQMSGCALVVRGLWRSVGVRHPLLERRYRIGMAVADVVKIAHEAKALHGSWATPWPGDVVLVGGPGSEHVYTVLRLLADGWPTPGATWLEALDGGQRDDQRAQICRVVEHEIGGDPPHDAGRHVRHVIDFSAVWERFGATPELDRRTPPAQ